MAANWLIDMLCGDPRAIDATNFQKYYDEWLRPQGAIYKGFDVVFGTDTSNAERVGAMLKQIPAAKDIRPAGVVTKAKNVDFMKPYGPGWGALILIGGHMIACGAPPKRLHSYFIIDSVRGLFGYTKASTMVDQLNAYIVHKGTDVKSIHLYAAVDKF